MRNAITEKILFLKIKNLDQEAFGQFYDLYVTKIYRFIFFKVSSVSEAHDLTSEVFLKLWQCLKEGKEIKNLGAYTYTLSRNLVIDHYRKKSRTEETNLDNPEVYGLPEDSRKGLAESMAIAEELKEVLKGLENLKDEYKEVIILSYLNELSISEIAVILNKSKGNVRVLLHRAMTALKNNLHER